MSFPNSIIGTASSDIPRSVAFLCAAAVFGIGLFRWLCPKEFSVPEKQANPQPEIPKLSQPNAKTTEASLPIPLSSQDIQSFISAGALVLPKAVTINAAATNVLSTFQETGNNVLSDNVEAFRPLLTSGLVQGALSSLLGSYYTLMPHRRQHTTFNGMKRQAGIEPHRDMWSARYHKHRSHHVWEILLVYFPDGATIEQGPTAWWPCSHYSSFDPSGRCTKVWNRGFPADNTVLCYPRAFVGVPEGTVVLFHHDLWHEAVRHLPTSTKIRPMLKLFFVRLVSPERTLSTLPWAYHQDVNALKKVLPTTDLSCVCEHNYAWLCCESPPQIDEACCDVPLLTEKICGVTSSCEDYTALEAAYQLGGIIGSVKLSEEKRCSAVSAVISLICDRRGLDKFYISDKVDGATAPAPSPALYGQWAAVAALQYWQNRKEDMVLDTLTLKLANIVEEHFNEESALFALFALTRAPGNRSHGGEVVRRVLRQCCPTHLRRVAVEGLRFDPSHPETEVILREILRADADAQVRFTAALTLASVAAHREASLSPETVALLKRKVDGNDSNRYVGMMCHVAWSWSEAFTRNRAKLDRSLEVNMKEARIDCPECRTRFPFWHPNDDK